MSSEERKAQMRAASARYRERRKVIHSPTKLSSSTVEIAAAIDRLAGAILEAVRYLSALFITTLLTKNYPRGGGGGPLRAPPVFVSESLEKTEKDTREVRGDQTVRLPSDDARDDVMTRHHPSSKPSGRGPRMPGPEAGQEVLIAWCAKWVIDWQHPSWPRFRDWAQSSPKAVKIHWGRCWASARDTWAAAPRSPPSGPRLVAARSYEPQERLWQSR